MPIQGAEWRALRQRYPRHALIVAGDFNQSLGDRHYYGRKEPRELLETQCKASNLTVLTGLALLRVPLAHPVIDHIAVAAPSGQEARLEGLSGWEGSWEGKERLSDHSGVVVAIDLQPVQLPAAPGRP